MFSKKFFAAALALLALPLFACAQLGMTAGALDFGAIRPGETKALSFGVFFAENSSAGFTVVSPYPSMVSAEPSAGTLEPGKIVWIRVSVKMPANASGKWEDFVRVRTAPPAQPGVANIQLEVAKKIIFYSPRAAPNETAGVPGGDLNNSAIVPLQPREPGPQKGPENQGMQYGIVFLAALAFLAAAFAWAVLAKRGKEAKARKARRLDARVYALLEELFKTVEGKKTGKPRRRAKRRKKVQKPEETLQEAGKPGKQSI